MTDDDGNRVYSLIEISKKVHLHRETVSARFRKRKIYPAFRYSGFNYYTAEQIDVISHQKWTKPVKSLRPSVLKNQLRIVETFLADPNKTQECLSKELGISLGAIDYSLNRFFKDGFVIAASKMNDC